MRLSAVIIMTVLCNAYLSFLVLVAAMFLFLLLVFPVGDILSIDHFDP